MVEASDQLVNEAMNIVCSSQETRDKAIFRAVDRAKSLERPLFVNHKRVDLDASMDLARVLHRAAKLIESVE